MGMLYFGNHGIHFRATHFLCVFHAMPSREVLVAMM